MGRMDRFRRDSRRLLTIGALLVIAGAVGGYVYPGLVNPVETVRGTITSSRFAAGGEGRSSLPYQRGTAILTVEYGVNGERCSLDESVSTVAGVGELYSVGSPITVYVRRGKGDTYATLAKPTPLIVVWVSMAIFGAAWMVIGWLMGRPVHQPTRSSVPPKLAGKPLK